MTITPKDFEEFDLPFAQVLTRKHDYMPDGYTLLNVTKLQDGTFEGRIDIGHMTRHFAPVVEKTETVAECCDKLDQRFWESMPGVPQAIFLRRPSDHRPT